ncbi:DUF1697 domain-containing protein [Anaerosolibacter sp.]|uniref:DUF1697 domain-containing protein n=1 Tax=Anaerosolibacter sp. TaxID=1872527 RepID=UPI0039F0DAF1
MNIHIALLRGINAGGNNIIKMNELKKTFEGMGLLGVKTYIQSGNVLFKSGEEAEILKKKIENAIEEQFRFSTTVILRTSEELEKIILDCPFSQEEILEAESMSETESLYVALLTNTPSKEKIEHLNAYSSDSDEYRIVGREVFLLLRKGIRNSKLANNLQKLEIPATVRNWRTINKLIALVKDMEL